jgi:hypothetical protein
MNKLLPGCFSGTLVPSSIISLRRWSEFAYMLECGQLIRPSGSFSFEWFCYYKKVEVNIYVYHS